MVLLPNTLFSQTIVFSGSVRKNIMIENCRVQRPNTRDRRKVTSRMKRLVNVRTSCKKCTTSDKKLTIMYKWNIVVMSTPIVFILPSSVPFPDGNPNSDNMVVRMTCVRKTGKR